MRKEISIITASIFRKNDPADVDASKMEEVISKYPYFAAARVLMAGKTAENEGPENNAVITAGLFVHNPLRLDWLLKQGAGSRPHDTDRLGGAETPEHSRHTGEPAQKEFFIESLAGSEPREIEPGSDEDRPAALNQVQSDEQKPAEQQEQSHTSTGQADDINHDHFSESSQAVLPDQHNVQANDQVHDEKAHFADERLPEPDPQSPPQINDPTPERFNPNAAASGNELQPQLKLQETVQQLLPAEDSPIAFQSYHTIDYFASQGIRLQQTELGSAKLGQQLKSFTEWLRSMKKLPSTEAGIPEGTDDKLRHHSVIQSAAHSIESKEILTEAMADVWAKQGNAEQAISIYMKLSLQNPGKSDYFAAKIDQLKAL